MPTVTETPITAYAHCVNPRCPGNAQVEVEAALVVTSYAYHETGGDGMFSHPERTTEQPRFRNPETEGRCDLCGSNRDLSVTRRMALVDAGFGDRNALLDIEPGRRYDPDTAGEVTERLRSEERERENSELRERLAKVEGFMLGQQPRASEPEVTEAPEPEPPLAHEADVELPGEPENDPED